MCVAVSVAVHVAAAAVSVAVHVAAKDVFDMNGDSLEDLLHVLAVVIIISPISSARGLLTYPLSHSFSRSLPHSLSLTHTHTPSLFHTLSLSLSLSLSLTHTHTHKHTRTHTNKSAGRIRAGFLQKGWTGDAQGVEGE